MIEHLPAQQLKLERAETQIRDFSRVIQTLLEGFAPRTQVEVWIDGEPPYAAHFWSQE